MQNNYLWLGVGVVIAILLAAGILLLRPHAAVAPTQTSTTTPQATGSTTEVNLGNGVTATLPAGVTITQVSSIPTPNLNQAVAYDPSLPGDAVATLRLDIASTTAYLKNNPTDGSEWLQLAIYYKIAGDYTAAASVWTYLTQVAPASYVAFANLGDLYQNFDINYPKAEANYLQAIKLNPQDVDIYADLYNLYRYEYKVSTTSAAAIVAQGLKANPGNLELLQLQQQIP